MNTRSGKTFTFTLLLFLLYLLKEETVLVGASQVLPSSSIITTLLDDSGQAGVQFDVLTKSLSINLKGLSIHTQLTKTFSVEVFSRRGTFIGFERTPSAWTRIGLFNNVFGNGAGALTALPEFDESGSGGNGAFMEANERYGLYVTVVTSCSTCSDLRFTTGNGVGEIFTLNDDLVVFTGKGIRYAFGRKVDNRVFNGKISYTTVGGSVPVVTPVPVPSPPAPSPPNGTAEEITTTYIDDSGQGGIQFDIQAVKDISLLEIDIHSRSTDLIKVLVYSKKGSFVGFERTPSAWAAVSTLQVIGKGLNKATPLEPLSKPISIASGATSALYISQVTCDTCDELRFTTGTGTGSVATNNGTMKVLVGRGIRYLFGRKIDNKLFNGSLRYTLGGTLPTPPLPPEPLPTPIPVMMPLPPTTSSPVSSPSSPVAVGELTTTYADDSGQAGIQFDLLAKKKIRIKSIDIHSQITGSLEIKIYTKSGSFEGFERKPSAWDLVFTGNIWGKGKYVPTPISVVGPINMATNGKSALYITIVTSCALCTDLRFTTGNGVGEVSAQNDDLVLFTGRGIRYEFGRKIDNKTFNGRIGYLLDGAVPSSSPVQTSPPTKAPTVSVTSTPVTATPVVSITPALLRIETNYSGDNNGQAGIMFDIRALKPLFLVAMDVHIAITGSVDYELYSKSGSLLGFERDPTVWSLMKKGNTTGLGRGVSSAIGNFDEISVESDSIQAIYITLVTACSTCQDLRYTEGSLIGALFLRNSEIEIYSGRGKRYVFGRNTALGCDFNGAIYYTLKSIPPIGPSPPTKSPTKPILSTPSPISSSTKAPVKVTTSSPTKELVGGILTSAFDKDDSGQAGIMFDLVTQPSIPSITIQSVGVHLIQTTYVDIEIYTKSGTMAGFERDSSAWSLWHSQKVVGRGRGQATDVGTFVPLTFKSTQALYVTAVSTTTTTEFIRYTTATSPTGTTFVENAHVKMLVGKGKRYIFGRNADNKGPNVVLSYITTRVPTGSPTLTPVTSPPTVCNLSFTCADRESCLLVELFNSTGGCKWVKRTNWLEDSVSVCKWYGVQCNLSGSIISLNLSYNNLVGTIPTALGQIVGLIELNLSRNSLSGGIPDSLGMPSNIQKIQLERNNFNGQISAGGLICNRVTTGKLSVLVTDCDVSCACCSSCLDLSPSSRPSYSLQPSIHPSSTPSASMKPSAVPSKV